MSDRPLVTWPQMHEAPEIRRRLRRLRPNAELLYDRTGKWMLGEVLPTWGRYLAGVALLKGWEERKALLGGAQMEHVDHYSIWRDAALLMQGFTWIRDYHGEPSGRIVEDYRRMCWKEEHGQLDAEYFMALTNSSDHQELQRKLERWRTEFRPHMQDVARFAYRRPRSIHLTQALARRRQMGAVA